MNLELDSRFSFLYNKVQDFEDTYGDKSILKFKDELLNFKKEAIDKYYILLKKFDDFEYGFLNSILNDVIKKNDDLTFDNIECKQMKKSLVSTFFNNSIPQWPYQQPKLQDQEKLRKEYRRKIKFLRNKKR